MRILLIALCGLACSCFGQSTVGNVSFTGSVTFGAAPVSGGGGGSVVIADTFVGSNGTDLTNHAPTTGSYTWVTDAPYFTIQNNAITNTSDLAQYTHYWLSPAMSSANYTAQVGVYQYTTGTRFALGIRDSGPPTATATAYFVIWKDDLAVGNLYKVVGGAYTKLGTDLTNVFTAGSLSNLWISAIGSSISAKINSVAIPGTPVTDTSIAGPGFVSMGPGLATSLSGASNSRYGIYTNLTVTTP